MPKVSVVVTSRNNEKYIKRALESLINQHFHDYEVIIVDDGSRDKSLEIIKSFTNRYQNFHLYTHKNEEYVGFIQTLKLGISKAKSEYIAFLTGEDYWREDYLQEKVRYVYNNPKTTILINDVNFEGTYFLYYDYLIANSQYYRDNAGLKNHFKNFDKKNGIPTFSSVMIASKVLKSLDFNSPDETRLGWWLWRQVAIQYPITYIDKKLTNWSKYDDNQLEDMDLRQQEIAFRKKSDSLLLKNYTSKYLKYRLKKFFRKLSKNIYSYKKTKDSFYNIRTVLGINFNILRAEFEKYQVMKNVRENFAFPVYEEPLVSIIVPAFNQYKYTIHCLYSILRTVKKIPYEVILADDASTDETENIREHVKNLNVVPMMQNVGFIKNCNNAAKQAKGKYIWFLSNSTQVLPNTLRNLLDTFEIEDKIGAVGSKSIFPNFALNEAGGIIYSDGSGYNYGTGDSNFLKQKFNYLKEVDYCSGVSLLVDRNLWKELGGFDERYTTYYEEPDLCFRIRQKGYKIIYQPKSVLIHFELSNQKSSTMQLIEENQAIFCEKWQDELSLQTDIPTDNFQARDRSQDKPVILFCDENILKPDKNDVDLSTLHYLQMFVNMGFNVKFLAKNYVFKSVYDKSLERYAEAIQQLGVEIIRADYIADWLLKYGKYVSYLYINKSLVYKYYESLFKVYIPHTFFMFNGQVVEYKKEAERALKSSNRELKYSAIRTQELEQGVWESADCIFYHTSEDVGAVLSYKPDLNVCRTPMFLYENSEKPYSYNANFRRDIMFVGDLNDSATTSSLVFFIDKIFPVVQKHIPGIQLFISGFNLPKELMPRRSDDILFVDYDELHILYPKVRLSIAPQTTKNSFHLSVVQSMQNGIPVVASKQAIDGIKNDQGLIVAANSGLEFANTLISLYKDTNKLNGISMGLRRYLEAHFLIGSARHIFEKILLSDD